MHLYQNESKLAIRLQFFVLIGFAVVLWLTDGFPLALTAMAGGLSVVLPSYAVYRWYFRYTGASQAASMLKALYWGEAGKMLFAGLGFVLCIKLASAPGAALLGWFVAILANWLVFFRILMVQRKKVCK